MKFFSRVLFCGLGLSAGLFGGGALVGQAAFAGSATASVDSGLYETPFAVRLANSDSESKIVYTTNGSSPRLPGALVYQNPIPVAATTILRFQSMNPAAAENADACRNYIFPRNVARQTGIGFPKSWGTNRGEAVVAHYAMDQNVAESGAAAKEIVPALKSLPSLCIAMSNDDLFDAKQGIYALPQESGAAWERSALIEWVDSGGSSGFQIHGGVRIQGGWNRRPEESPKHSFRLVFRKKYGAGKLRFSLFDPGRVEEFDTLILRGGNNNSWLHWSGDERKRADYIRDQWMRDTFSEMGQLSSRGRFVHLYLNGLYWGVYNLCERPDASFAAYHLGGNPKDYDARNADKILEGDDRAWENLMRLVNAEVTDSKQFVEVQKRVNLTNLVDYLILNFYGANADWDRSSNWYAARRRHPAGSFQFFVWDGERTLEEINDNTMAFDDDQSPPRIFSKLKESADFKVLFADRAYRHLLPGGALSEMKSAARFSRYVKELDSAVLAESARWGNYRNAIHRYKTGPYENYTREKHWRPEVNRILSEYFPRRTSVVVEMFRKAGLYHAPPLFRRTASEIQFEQDGSEIYFCADGSDPRLAGGGISPSAQKLTQGRVSIPDSLTVRGRARDGEWSALLAFP